MKRTATYADNRSCDWCRCPIPPGKFIGKRRKDGGWDRRMDDNSYYDPHMVKFVSPIDGNYVRARLCPEHREKILGLMEVGA